MEAVKVIKVLLSIVSTVSGLAAAVFWFRSGLLKAPKMEKVSSVIADEIGMSPADRYLGDVSRLNRIGVICTAISVGAGAIAQLL